MGLRELELLSSYETEREKTHLLDTFYIPVLEQAQAYYRIAGFFSSSALTVAAEGIEGLIHNGGKMYLLISPALSKSDYETIQRHGIVQAEDAMFQDFDVTGPVSDNVRALAWMLDKGYLKIKIVIGRQSPVSLFHQKVGIITDKAGDQISFSGSINETARGWMENIEEFKVFRSWERGQLEYVNSDFQKFCDYWKNKRPQVAAVYDLPEAITEKLIRVKPDDVMELSIMRRYGKSLKQGGTKNRLSLFPHQEKAVERWKANGGSLLMEMATGTGKTRTAIGCMLEALKKEPKLLVIVATPQNTLSRQWMEDMQALDIRLDEKRIIDGSNSQWKKELKVLLLSIGRTVQQAVVFTTHDTASSPDFLRMVEQFKGGTKVLFICDEVHAVGSARQREALLPAYEYRIGLSATPERLFDEEGSELIREYFGNQSFEFTISDALQTINPLTGHPFLNPYAYYPQFVHLSDEEYKKFKRHQQIVAALLQEIAKRKKEHKPFQEEETKLEEQYLQRANIIKNAEEKIAMLDSLLDRMGPRDVQDTIVFVSDKQMKTVMNLMAKKGIVRSKITEEESAKKKVRDTGRTERQQILDDFSNHIIQVILGIKCLDEGIDITSARVAILLANSVNPREYIQRIGRVIRPGKEKGISEIYDCVVLGDEDTPLLRSELHRVAFISDNAVNREEVHRLFMEKGVDLDEYQQENQRSD